MATTEELRKRAETLRQTAQSGEIITSDPQAVVVSLMAEAASLMWAASAREHIEAKGEKFFDYRHTWLPERERAMESYRKACEKRRKREGDQEIVRRIEEIEGKERGEAYKVTRARGKVLRALVSITSESGRLFCSYQTLASTARVSARTACTVRAELESLGVLERVRTGGKAADGTCHSNKYTVKWNVLRQVLGIRNRWSSRYPTDTKGMLMCQNPTQSKGLYNWASETGKVIVENSSTGNKANMSLSENTASEQGFCALTELLNQNKPFKTRPERPFLSKQNQPGENPGNETMGQTVLHAVKPCLRHRLDKASKGKRSFILAELAAHIKWTPPYAPLPEMIENYLDPVLQSEGL